MHLREQHNALVEEEEADNPFDYVVKKEIMDVQQQECLKNFENNLNSWDQSINSILYANDNLNLGLENQQLSRPEDEQPQDLCKVERDSTFTPSPESQIADVNGVYNVEREPSPQMRAKSPLDPRSFPTDKMSHGLDLNSKEDIPLAFDSDMRQDHSQINQDIEPSMSPEINTNLSDVFELKSILKRLNNADIHKFINR